MAALDVDSSSHSEYLQHGNGAASASAGAAAPQDAQPSPLALLAATCSKIGPPSPEEDEAAAAAAASHSAGAVQLSCSPSYCRLNFCPYLSCAVGSERSLDDLGTLCDEMDLAD